MEKTGGNIINMKKILNKKINKDLLINQHIATQSIQFAEINNVLNDPVNNLEIDSNYAILNSNMPIDFNEITNINDDIEIDIFDQNNFDIELTTKTKFITAREFYSYKLHDRPSKL